jgi:hypothetical protein
VNGYNFTDRVRKVLQMAREEAMRLQHEYVGTEHILLGLLHEGEGVAAAALTNLNVDFEEVAANVYDTVKKGKNEVRSLDLPYTSRAKKVLELSMSQARELNHTYVGTEHLLLGVLREKKGIAAQALIGAGITLETACAEVLRLLGDEGPDSGIGREHPDTADQRFKTAIALVELHHLRFGSYPDSFDDLEFLGAQDRHTLLKGLRYEKLPDGYGLDIVSGKDQKPRVTYPPDFWRGLGIRRTNVDRSSGA